MGFSNQMTVESRIKSAIFQRMKGRKLKTADALIIATAIENQLAIVSRGSDMYFTEKEFGIPVIRP
jgi:tRNA(fMet)-specific endonuclease VapC